MSDYKKTLQLPRTSFPMKANLTRNEPETLRFWQEIDAYGAMIGANAGKEAYVLHDGPPYANGHIHLGTALNKVLKDIVVKSRNMRGQRAEYVPGWDCHGLPIEHKVELELGGKDLPATAIRQRCREYAASYLDIQREEFKRLGVFGVWDQPYLTMHPAYEAATAGELADFMARGSVTRSKKPIHWCISCQTALAEAEVEYKDHGSHSIFVRFPLPDPALSAVFPQADATRTSVVIWTTTPWTIPDNMAVAVHPEFDYALVERHGEYFILAKDRVDACLAAFGWDDARVLDTVKGQALEGLKARHPFYDRSSPLVLADYVTLDAGAGCVHTAPGHGQEDYETGLRYGLEVLSPLSDEGRFLDSVEFFAGLTVFEANPKVIEILQERGNLLAQGKIAHSYPHCWRCKKPVVFRATTQWFISMEANGLRTRALEAIDGQVRWIPAWGRERIHNMIANRPDWCISRQRMWGVPIVALLCEACDTAWYDAAWVRSVVDRFESYPTGCDYWFDTPLEALAPAGLTCPHCGAARWKKETDILDVWFDSGTSFAAVVEKRPECSFPADLYLEGSDQHRGWFHSSLLAAVGTRGVPPYRTVLTHGYVVDGEGKKMSKSVGNVVAPQEIIDKFGAEILRMWVASVDYQEDVRISDEILSRLVDAYRRIRNTCRYLLGNLDDFSAADALPTEAMLPLDRYALDLAWRSCERIGKAYDAFEFHRVFHTLHNHCVTELSAFYLDILKDRLYVEAKDGVKRRSAQTALWKMLMLLLRGMAPVLSFTAEEVFRHLPAGLKPQATTVFALEPELPPADLLTEAEREAWETVMAVRAEVTKAIEPFRQSGEIGHSLSAHVTLYVPDDVRAALAASGADLKETFIVSGLTLEDADAAPEGCACGEQLTGLKIAVSKAAGEKCQRCWVMSEELGTDPAWPDVCPRCLAALRQSG